MRLQGNSHAPTVWSLRCWGDGASSPHQPEGVCDLQGHLTWPCCQARRLLLMRLLILIRTDHEDLDGFLDCAASTEGLHRQPFFLWHTKILYLFIRVVSNVAIMLESNQTISTPLLS